MRVMPQRAVMEGMGFRSRQAHAVARGAVAVVCEEDLPGIGCARVVVPSSREALARLACAFYDHPARRLKLVGVTGTNGKTTTTYLVESILARGRRRPASSAPSTTASGAGSARRPTPPRSRSTCSGCSREMRDAGATHVVMEVSSHAPRPQAGATACPFDVAVFTNLTRDHLDYHRTWSATSRPSAASSPSC